MFLGFKRLFNRKIAILPHQKNDMVSFVKLRRRILKMGTNLVVDENYNFVIVHYNRVCDIFLPGVHKIEDVTVPKLFKYSKTAFTKRGFFTANGIRADVYFINLNPFKLNMFKTPENVVVFGDNGEKIKVKLEGTFTLTILNSSKIMRALCNDFAVITNKKALREIKAKIGFDVSKILNEKGFTLDELLKDRKKIIETLNDEINNYVEMYGLKITDFFINSVIFHKKNIIDKAKEEVLGQENSNIDIVKLVEEKINNIDEFNKVEVKVSKNNQNQQNLTNVNYNKQSDFVLNTFNNNQGNPKQQESVFNMPYTPLVPDYSTNVKDPNVIDETLPEEEKQNTSNTNKINDKSNDKNKSDLKSNDVKTQEKQKSCKNCGANINKDDVFCSKCGKSTQKFIICPCCGAKNFEKAKTCCVCKSELK